MRSKRLSRQIKKAFGTEETEGLFALKVDDWTSKFDCFLQSVDEAYQQLEEREQMAQRNMELSGAELTLANSRLFAMNQAFDAMLNSLGQGFLLVSKDGICQDIYSKACETLLEIQPAGKSIIEVLKVSEAKASIFTDWLEILFRDALDFAEFSRLGPQSFAHSGGRFISLEYKPVRGRNGDIDFVMVIATDISKEMLATRRAENLQAQANFITNIVQNKERFRQFVKEFRGSVIECNELIALGIEGDSLNTIKQRIHGIKGTSGTFGMVHVHEKANEFESQIAAQEVERNNHSVVNMRPILSRGIAEIQQTFEECLQQNADLVSELIATQEPHREIALSRLRKFSDLLPSSAGSQRSLRHEFIESFVAVPISEILTHFNVSLQQVARHFNKKIGPVQISGDDPHLVPEDFGRLWDDLEHVFRNIGDHGIESPEQRSALGKPEFGLVQIKVKLLDDAVQIFIKDDGAGIDVAKVSSAISRKILSPEDQALVEKNPLEAIFFSGLSTVDKVSTISGRGIGLCAVRSSLGKFGGSISVKSQIGQSTEFSILLPLNFNSPRKSTT